MKNQHITIEFDLLAKAAIRLRSARGAAAENDPVLAQCEETLAAHGFDPLRYQWKIDVCEHTLPSEADLDEALAGPWDSDGEFVHWVLDNLRSVQKAVIRSEDYDDPAPIDVIARKLVAMDVDLDMIDGTADLYRHDGAHVENFQYQTVSDRSLLADIEGRLTAMGKLPSLVAKPAP